MKRLLILLSTFSSIIYAAELEGVVALPVPKATAAQTRYQLPSGTVAPVDAPAAIVYLDGKFAAAGAGTLTNETVWQKGYQFTPALLAVRVGTPVAFANLDDDYHHVFSYSKPKEFDLGRYRKDETAPKVIFDKAGLVRMGCEIHDHMRAVILVLETPYFVKTDAAGKYRLTIPSSVTGPFTVKAWVSDKDVREQKIELKESAVLKVDFPGK